MDGSASKAWSKSVNQLSPLSNPFTDFTWLALDPNTSQYTPLRKIDNQALNENISASSPDLTLSFHKSSLPIEFTRATADLTNFNLRYNYWDEKPKTMAFSNWFYLPADRKKPTPQPLSPKDAALCEALYERFSQTSAAATIVLDEFQTPLTTLYNEKLYKVVIVEGEAPPNATKRKTSLSSLTAPGTTPPPPPPTVKYYKLKLKATGMSNMFSPDLTLQRGYGEYSVDGESEETLLSPATGHVVFVIHGIGEHFFGKKENTFAPSLVEQVAATRVDIHKRQISDWTARRALAEKSAQTHKQVAALPPPPARIEVLPIVWSDVWHVGTDTKISLERCTIASIPTIRTVANDIIFDVMQYQSTALRNKTLKFVSELINDIHTSYSSMNQDYKGALSLIGHSLGSVITWDLVALASKAGDEAATTEMVDEDAVSSSHLPENSNLSTPPLPAVCSNVFLVGSPIGLFLTLRGAQSALADPSFALSAAKNLVNIYHPSDPVAYRLEPLLTDKAFADAAFVPAADSSFAGKNGVRFHLQSKKTMDDASKAVAKATKAASRFMSKGAFSFMDTMAKGMGVTDDATDKEERGGSVDSAGEVEEVGAVYKLGGGGGEGSRVDYQMQTGLVENEMLAALTAHTGYFANDDFVAMVVRCVERAEVGPGALQEEALAVD